MRRLKLLGLAAALELVTLVVLLAVVRAHQPHPGAFVVSGREGKRVPIPLPFMNLKGEPGAYTYEGRIYSPYEGALSLNFISDGCVQTIAMNGARVSLDGISRNDRCNPSRGFVLDLSKNSRPGQNSVKVTVASSSSVQALTIQPSSLRLSWYQAALFFLLSLLLGAKLCRAAGLPWKDVLLLAAAYALRVWYLRYTNLDQRSYDVLEGGGHLDYIRYIAAAFAFPPPNGGWEYHQPPFYYLLGAAILRLSQLVSSDGSYLVLQIYSLACFMVFLFFGIRLLSFYFSHRRIYYTLAALLCFWPAGVIHSIRIGNDVLLYALYAGSLYCAVRWWQHPGRSYFWAAMILCALAMVTKTNAVSLAFTMFVMLALTPLRPLVTWGKVHRFLAFGFLMFTAAAVNLGDNIYFALQNQSDDWLLGSVTQTINRGLFVDRSLKSFISFDLDGYLRSPFTSTWTDEGGRQFFWNFFLKTSLFGEFSFNRLPALELAAAMTWLLMAMLPFVLCGALVTRREQLQSRLPILISLVSSVGLLIAYSIKVPSSSNSDFRYIFPVLISFCCCYGWSWEFFSIRRIHTLSALNTMTALLFTAASVAFFSVFPFLWPG